MSWPVGKPFSAEHRARISAAMTPATRAKISAALTGRPKSAKSRAKMSVSHMGRKTGPRETFSPESRAKMSAAAMGKKRGPQSAEHRAALSAAHAGKTYPTRIRAAQLKGGPIVDAATRARLHALRGGKPLSSAQGEAPTGGRS